MDLSLIIELAINGALIGLMYALVALGIVLIYKTSGLANLAQGAIAMTGAYLTWAVASGVGAPIWLAIPLALVLMFGIGMLIERLALRRMIGQPVIMAIMLTLGIIHETLLRWAPPPVRVLAQVHAFISTRIDPESGVRRPVGTPDSVQVLAILENGARAVYHLSGVTPFGQGMGISLYGTEGVLHYDIAADRLWGASRRRGAASAQRQGLEELPIPPEKALSWRVEADFVDAIRRQTPIQFTDFATGVAYMEFTEAVARSAQREQAVELPLSEFRDADEDG